MKGADTLLKVVKWDLIFGNVLLGSKGRHGIFKNHLEMMFGSAKIG